MTLSDVLLDLYVSREPALLALDRQSADWFAASSVFQWFPFKSIFDASKWFAALDAVVSLLCFLPSLVVEFMDSQWLWLSFLFSICEGKRSLVVLLLEEISAEINPGCGLV